MMPIEATQTLTVLMGTPGAGKTTWLNKQSLDGVHIASTEPVRKDKTLDVHGFMNWLRWSARNAAAEGLSILSDGTNIDQRHRAFWLALATEYNMTTRLVVFKTDLALCLQAQTTRLAPVDNKLVRKYDRDMGIALRQIHVEPWDSIEFVTRSQSSGRF